MRSDGLWRFACGDVSYKEVYHVRCVQYKLLEKWYWSTIWEEKKKCATDISETNVVDNGTVATGQRCQKQWMFVRFTISSDVVQQLLAHIIVKLAQSSNRLCSSAQVGGAQTRGGAAHISVPFSQLAFDRGSQLDEQANAVKKLAPS